MKKYEITVKVETFVKPHELNNSSFKYMFMRDLGSFINEGIDIENGFDGIDNNILALSDGELRHFTTKFSLQTTETEEKEEAVDRSRFE